MKNLKYFFIGCIRLYQKILSPNHNLLGIRSSRYGCRFHPSCSEYAIEALRQYGLLRGSVVSLRRLARCTAWSRGGYDPVR